MALLGGRDFAESQFDRATQSRRQPGSAFKPVIYAAALERGMSPARVLIDAPIVEDAGAGDEVWKPKNYRDKFYGPTLLRTALALSRNVITVKLLKEIGVQTAIEFARKLGIESELSADLSLALGSSGVSLLELTKAYSVFANRGARVEPIFITSITDRDGKVLEENRPRASPVLSEQTAYVMTDLLRAVVEEGTGSRVRALKRPAAGKTGTTNEHRDAWYLGYTPELLAGVWVGYDDLQEMGRGETGAEAACPIWLYFMREVLRDRPAQDFAVPEGVVFATIDKNTGLLANEYSAGSVNQAFVQGTEPVESTPPPKAAKKGQFVLFDMQQD
jgi:penicillin-binding protein 1A